MASLDWFTFAEEDRRALEALLILDRVPSSVGYLAEQCLEKYIKHVVCVAENIGAGQNYKIPYDSGSGTHSLPYLLHRLYRMDGVAMPYALREDIYKIATFYYTTRYPDVEGAHIITKDEANVCIAAVSSIRNWTLEAMRNIRSRGVEDGAEHER